MQRRSFLAGLASLATAPTLFGPTAVDASAETTAEAAGSGPALYVPGYDSGAAFVGGVPLRDDRHHGRAVPAGYDGPVTLLTRIDLASGKTIRAAYPIQGHAVAVAPNADIGVFASIRDDRLLAFDTASLDLSAISHPFADGFTGGGHAKYLPDGSALLVTERAPYRPYGGRPEEHFGRLTLRDPATLKVLESFGCDGLHPHDLQIVDQGRYVAVANYGSTLNGKPAAVAPEIVEPSVTVIELASGRVVDKITVPSERNETRHLAAVDANDYFVVQVAIGTLADWVREMPEQRQHLVTERDRLAQPGAVYLPAPLVRISRRTGGLARVAQIAPEGDMSLMRQGLSILHEPRYDQVIVTFPTTHRVMVVDARSGKIVRILRTDTMGLRYPCGLALHPDGKRYVVTGSFENVFLFDRQNHSLDRASCRYIPLFRHSHIAVG